MWHHARVIRNDALHSPEKLTEIGVRDLLAELEDDEKERHP
ncbi:hypothetical protein [Leptospirillum ferriphilum]|uniref:DUF4145 domain-containing protein n=1 Tax=Leptospirillum ferriphilum (strain ML-04) TaxID=1048260 RepID=J9ZCI1_LEPFM|nr:hypothetical protein [Leptospirillum ferriphilum]AFS53573.1 hypothetical protein LFML04_1348 [Leptospirillum ferriphilum ML-04]